MLVTLLTVTIDSYGKIHAVIARSWKNCVKGRDLYDYIYYLSLDTKVNLKHLEARLKQTKTIEEDVNLTRELLIEIIEKRFDLISYETTKSDIRQFIKDQNNLDIWSSESFKSITKELKVDLFR